MKRWLPVIPVLAVIALAALFYTKSLHRDPQVQPQALVGHAAPDLTLPSLETGQPKRLLALTGGQPMLVNFFASNCPPCEVENPALRALKAEGVWIIGVAYKDDSAKTKSFLERLGDPYAARLVDADGRGGLEFGVTGPPETYLVDSDGMVLAKHVGAITPADAEAMLAKISH